jgi:hypothetical protein
VQPRPPSGAGALSGSADWQRPSRDSRTHLLFGRLAANAGPPDALAESGVAHDDAATRAQRIDTEAIPVGYCGLYAGGSILLVAHSAPAITLRGLLACLPALR